MAPRVNLPPATRTVLLCLLSLSFLYNVARWRQLDTTPGTIQPPPTVPYLTLVPSRFLRYPWTLLTATFVEQNIFTVLLNGATIFYGGKYLERAWGSREFGKFILIVTLASNVACVPLYLLWPVITRHPLEGYGFFFSSDSSCSTASCTAPVADALLSASSYRTIQICGGVAIQGSFLVAFKQLVPEHTVTIFKGLVKTRVKHFPALFLLLNTISGVIFGTDVAAVLAWLGLLTSWTYLRFYKRQPDLTGTSTDGLGIKGDASETFAFACFFPDVMQPPIAFVGDRIYNLLVSLKICTPFSEEDIASGNQQALARGEAGLPNLLSHHRGMAGRGSARREEAERRRALALRALDQRLQAAVAAKPPPPTTTTTTTITVPPASQLAQSQMRPSTPTVSSGQAMLGETSYHPDHA